MATKHASNTGKQTQAGRKQAAGKHQDVQPEAKQKKHPEKQTNRVKENTTAPVDENARTDEREEHRDEREFVGQMDGAQANKELEGHAPYDHSHHDHPEDFDRAEDMREKTKAGALPIENEHRARDHAGGRHQ